MTGFRRDPDEPPFVPPGGPPQHGPPREVYAAMGEAAIVRMIRDLYREIGSSDIRAMFPEDLEKAAEKSASFFVFLLGGPPLYQQRHGPPMMRKRHLPFRIDEKARRVWLGCFDRVLEKAEERYGFPAEHKPAFRRFLDEFSSWMVNSQGPQ